MNITIKIILFTIVFTLSANFIFGQTTTSTPMRTASDDSDGDGVKNSADLCPNDKGTIANKGCPGKDDQKQSNEKPKKQDSLTDGLYSNIDTASLFNSSNLSASDKKALADCQFVYQNEGCAKYLGMSKTEIIRIFGGSDSYGDYYRLGIHFWYFDDSYLGEITFQGVTSSKDNSPFLGKPAQNLSWGASIEETISKLGKPANRDESNSFAYLRYGIYRFTFQYNKLRSVAIEDVEGRKLGKSTMKNNESASTAKVELVDPATMPRPQNNQQSGSFADCKYILSDGCLNYFFHSGIDFVAKQLNLSRNYDEFISMDIFENSNRSIQLIVEPSTGRILEAVIKRNIVENDKAIKPHKDLKWDLRFEKAQKQLGETRFYWTDRFTVLVYRNYELSYRLGDLDNVKFKQNPTETESVSRKRRALIDQELRVARQREENIKRDEAKRREAEIEANKTPEQRAREKAERAKREAEAIVWEYNSFHDRVEAKIIQANELTEYLNKNSHRLLPSMVRSRQEEITKIRKETSDMIVDFMTKNKGRLSQAMIDHLNEDLAKLT